MNSLCYSTFKYLQRPLEIVTKKKKKNEHFLTKDLSQRELQVFQEIKNTGTFLQHLKKVEQDIIKILKAHR